MKATVKESADGNFVLRTIERSRLWEIHTPQVPLYIKSTQFSSRLGLACLMAS
jgi:2-C-methyl-D-erythritol 4-phosphate cytidylyltransferase